MLDRRTRRFLASFSAAALLACVRATPAQTLATDESDTGALAQAAAQELPPVQVNGNYLNGVGSSDAASAGTVTSRLIERLRLTATARF